MHTLIRPYRETDFAEVMELFRLNVPNYFSAEEQTHLEHYLKNEIEEYFVLELETKIAGCGGINFSKEKNQAIISWDFFHPAQQGKGLGSTLLVYRLNKIKVLRDIQSVVVRTSQHTFRFYEKNGFELKETVPDYWAPGFDLYRMELTY